VRALALECGARLRIACQHHALAWAEREHVGSHRRELLVGNFDETVPSLDKFFDKRHRQERGIDDREVAIDGADERHQMKHVARPAPVGKRHHDQVVDGIAQQRAKLQDACGIRAIAAADRNGAVIEPQDVASLEASWLRDLADDRNAKIAERRSLRRGLAGAETLAHPAEDDPAWGHDRCIARVDGIEIGPLVGGEKIDLRARRAQGVEQRLILLDRAREHGRPGKAERPPLRGDDVVVDESLSRVLDQHAGESTELGERVIAHAVSACSSPSPT